MGNNKSKVLILICLIILSVIITYLITKKVPQDRENNSNINFTDKESMWLEKNKDKTFTLATESTVGLTTFIDKENNGSGLQYKIIRQIKNDLGINIEIAPQVSIPEFIDSLKTKKYDLYIGPNENEERTKYVNFMPNIWKSEYYCYYRKEHCILSIHSLREQKVGFIKDDYIISELEKLYKVDYIPVYYNNREELFNALETQEVVAIFTALPFSNHSNNIEVGFRINSVNSSLARLSVNNDKPILSNIIKKEISYLEERGIMDEILEKTKKEYNKYLLSLLLTKEEKVWLNNNPILHIGFAKGSSPYNIYKGNTYSGINLDYLNEIADLLDLEYKVCDNINNLSWDDTIKKCMLGDIHLITSTAGDYVNNGGKLLYTIPYLKFNTLVVGKEQAEDIHNPHDLENKRVVIEKSSPISYYLKEKLSIDKLFIVGSESQAIEMILNNEADYTIYSDNKAAIVYNKIISKDLKYKGELNLKLYQQFGVSKKHEELLTIMNKVITLLEDENIINGYNYLEINANKYKQQYYRMIAVAGIIFFTIIILVLYRLYRTSEKHREYEKKIRTQEIELQRYSKKERGERAASIAFVEWNMVDDTLITTDFLYELMGYSREELSNHIKDWLVPIHPDDIDYFYRTIEKAKQGLIDVTNIEYRYKNGNTLEYMWLKATYKVLEYDAKGKPVRAIGMHQDITQMKEMEQTIRQNEKMTTIGQLASGIAHDFNNILAGVLGYAELLNTKYKEDKVHNQWTEQIIKAANRATRLTRKLLDFSRKSPMVKTNMNINNCIEDAIKILHYNLNKNVDIVTNFVKDDIYIMGDNTQLETIFINLGVNANDAMPNGGQITFSTDIIELDTNYIMKKGLNTKLNKFVKIEVKDTGSGMSKEIADKIFEPFFTTKEIGKGVGLGLSSVEGIVMAHKGFIELDTTEGKGTIFMIYLPLEEFEGDNNERNSS